MRDTLELNLLGGFQLLDAQGREIAIRGSKVKALLAYLALAPDGPQARAKLAGLVWGDHSETRARQNLRQGLSTLRRALGERADAILVTDESSIKLAEGAVTTDAVMLERAVEDDDLEATIDLYTGELLDDLGPVFESFDDWLAAARLRLRDLAADSWQALGERRLDSRDPAGAIEVARKLVELEVLREPAHRLLMRAYVAAGRRTEALQQYHILERTLDAELDATPDAESQRLFEEVGVKRSPPAPERAGEKPVIAVLPFTNMSGDPDQEYFADGITDDIITELSRSRMFDVVARNSVFGYKGANVDIRRLGSELNVEYVIEGSVRRADDRVRITAQLIDASADTHVWAEHYDRELADVFAVQDDITHAIVATIAPEYLSAEKRRAARKPARNLDAWDNFIRAYFHLSQFTRANHEAGIEAINRAIELDPLGAGHHALLAVLLTTLAFYGWGRSRAEVMHQAREAAEVALGLDDRDALVLRAMGMVNMYERRTEEAVHYFERAVEIDPHEAENYALIGNALGLAGDYEGAVERVEQALKLSPRDTFMSTWYSNLAMAAVAANRDADAESWARTTIQRGPRFPGGYRTLTVALAHLDRIEEARGALARLRELLPDVSVAELREALPITHPEHLERYLDGLKKAGLV